MQVHGFLTICIILYYISPVILYVLKGDGADKHATDLPVDDFKNSITKRPLLRIIRSPNIYVEAVQNKSEDSMPHQLPLLPVHRPHIMLPPQMPLLSAPLLPPLAPLPSHSLSPVTTYQKIHKRQPINFIEHYKPPSVNAELHNNYRENHIIIDGNTPPHFRNENPGDILHFSDNVNEFARSLIPGSVNNMLQAHPIRSKGNKHYLDSQNAETVSHDYNSTLDGEQTNAIYDSDKENIAARKSSTISTVEFEFTTEAVTDITDYGTTDLVTFDEDDLNRSNLPESVIASLIGR